MKNTRRARALVLAFAVVTPALARADGIANVPLPLLRPTGRIASPGHTGGGPVGGFLLGVDAGVSLSLPSGADPSERSWTLGVRAGYLFANGLALTARYDYLGLAPHLTNPPHPPMQIASAGLRYSLPFLVLPFVEAMWGPSFEGGDVAVAGGLGVGVSIPAGRHVLLDVGARDWITPIAGDVHQTLLFELGGAVSFGSLGR